jgi:protein-disulfide isomerase
MRWSSWILAVAVGAVLGVALTWFIVGGKTKSTPRAARPAGQAGAAVARGPEDPHAVYRVPLEDSPVKGPADALVTVVVSSDFQCPFCRRLLPVMAQLEQQYAGKIRFAFKHNPLAFHALALPAALAAEEARAQGGDAKFWAMHDALFEAPALDAAALEAAAAKVGLDLAAFRRALEEERHLARVKRDQALVVGLGATGTPTSFVNGRKLVGAQPYEAFRQVVEEELAAAGKLVAGGVPAREVYARIMEKAETAPVRLPAGAAPAAPRAPPAQAAKVSFRADDPARGPATAKVTVVLFSDFQCPFCARMEPTLRGLEAAWPGLVRVVWKHQPLPFHAQAFPAAMAAEAARAQGKFWPMHDKLFANQAALASAPYARWAGELGLDVARFEKDLSSSAARARIEEDQRLAAQVGAQGTPTSFLNCRKLVGALPLESFRAAVEEELRKADAAIAAGVKPGPALYERLCEENVKTLAAAPPAPVPPEAAPAPALDAKAVLREVRADDPARGKRGAPLTVLVFSDFECPFCSRALPTLKQIEQTYRDDVRIVWKHQPLPFHKNALPAALAAEAARQQGKFWEMHDKMFENQRDLSQASLERLAGELGLDLARFRAATQDPALRARVEQDQALAQRLGANGTPTFIVGGERVVGALPFESFRPVIDRQLAAMRAR